MALFFCMQQRRVHPEKTLFEEKPCPFMYDFSVNLLLPSLSKPLLRAGSDAREFNTAESQKIAGEIHRIVMKTDKEYVNFYWVQNPNTVLWGSTAVLILASFVLSFVSVISPVLGLLVTILQLIAWFLLIFGAWRAWKLSTIWRKKVMEGLRPYVENTLRQRYPHVECTLMYPFFTGATQRADCCVAGKTVVRGVWFVLRISRNPLLKTPGPVYACTLARYAKQKVIVMSQPAPRPIPVPVQPKQKELITIVYKDDHKPSLRAGQTYAVQTPMKQMHALASPGAERIVVPTDEEDAAEEETENYE